MGRLLYKKSNLKLSPGVTLVQNLDETNANLEHIQFKVIEMENTATYGEELLDKELCAVVLTGNVDVTVDQENFKNLGTRDSVFEKKPTDSIYIGSRSEEHTSELQSRFDLVCRL